ncbi:glycosyltransferase family 2 protein [Acidiferrobacter sp.]|uniref:glycosyltransferase family 2 protein n=1 Tax=Acidiferrobacter sp. TaxID=1872107 RepID=UPI00261E0F38|nr:glycosyltransferase family 2 protein [Acidiferrobacter sp.]
MNSAGPASAAFDDQPVLSFVVPCYNEAANIRALYERICAVMAACPETWECICVNDGSRDETLGALTALQDKDPRVRVIDLSRNFGKEAALTAGLDHARGAAAIPLDADFQDPPELIPELVAHWRAGYDVVNAVRLSREGESLVKRASAHAFYRIFNRISKVPIPEDTGDFRLLSRPVLDALRQLPERRRFMKGLFAWVGFRTTSVSYHRAPRQAGHTTWNYVRLWRFAMDGILSFSDAPLRVASYLGLAVSLLSFLYALNLLVQTLLFGNPVKGYPSLMVALLFLGGVQLMALGVIGEYLGRVYDESKGRPVYIIRHPLKADRRIAELPPSPANR